MAGLEAAKIVGFPTGGYMPKGFINHNGNNPEFAELYGITEHSSSKYAPRTFDNAKNSDATLRFAVDFSTAGELCTLKAIRQYNKLFLDIKMKKDSNVVPNPKSVDFIVKWIVDNKIKVLNVAGNSNKTHHLMQEKVRNFMIKVLEKN